MAVLDEITAANSREPIDRLGGAITDPFQSFMTLYWKGEIPASVQAIIDRHADTVPVRVVPRNYTFVELQQESHRLLTSMVAEGAPVQMTAPDIETNGVIVRIIGNTENAKASTVLSTAKVPVKVEYGHVPIQASSRYDDSSPYYSGARANACTVGWPVWTSAGARITTAAHCGDHGTGFYDGGGDYMGHLYNVVKGKDSALINALGAGRMWDGPWNTPDYTKRITGYAGLAIGFLMCSSGSYSGVTCGINPRRFGVGMVIQGYIVSPAVEVEQVDNGPLWGRGDSGGPVFSLSGSNINDIWARGTIAAVDPHRDFVRNCAGLPDRNCSQRGYIIDMNNVLAAVGASNVITG